LDAIDEPNELTATTLNFWLLPPTKFKIEQVVSGATAVHVAPSVEVTTYDEIGLPPFDSGADHVKVVDAQPLVATRFKGALGIVPAIAVTASDGADVRPSPLVPVTVTTSETLFVTSSNVHVNVSGVPVQLCPCESVTV
jgi:hypothetical protein